MTDCGQPGVAIHVRKARENNDDTDQSWLISRKLGNCPKNEQLYSRLFGQCTFGGWGSKPLPGWFGALFLLLEPYGHITLQKVPEKGPQSARLSAGGSNCYLGNAQINSMISSMVLT